MLGRNSLLERSLLCRSAGVLDGHSHVPSKSVIALPLFVLQPSTLVQIASNKWGSRQYETRDEFIQ